MCVVRVKELVPTLKKLTPENENWDPCAIPSELSFLWGRGHPVPLLSSSGSATEIKQVQIFLSGIQFALKADLH